ncbi:PAS domain S-box protein [Leptolyngbya sp. DQ-M1]|uniref:PAS domain-containing sensor histidine kinase n=1 Tax=Leptolyngbya sp. DQ-M1 TaxID=2933920 RepID=UPI0032969B81
MLSQLNAVLEASLLDCAIFIALHTDEADSCRQALRCVLGSENYQYLVTFIAYVKTCHEWMEAHSEVSYATDKRAQDHLNGLISEEPQIAHFFETYWDRAKQERLEWLKKQSTVGLQADELPQSPFAQAFHFASEGILLSDPNQPDNPIIYANPAFSKLTGYELEEIRGSNCRFLQGSDTDPEVVAQIREAIVQQREIQATLLNYRKDGQPFWNELKLAPVRADTGQLLYFVGIQTDVTERKESDAQLQAKATLLDQSQNAILLLSLDHRILFWNSSATRLFGWTADEAVGCCFDNLIFEGVSPQLHQAQSLVLEQGAWQGELQHRAKDGRKVIVDSYWTLIRVSVGQPQSILVSSTNITERKQTEALHQRIQRFESISTVTSGMAHHLNNALTPVLMSIHLLASRLTDEQSRRLLTILEQNTKRSADVIEQVLSFVGGLKGNRSPLAVAFWLLEITESLEQNFPGNIQVQTDVAVDLWTIAGDPSQLHQMLLNLCQNACDAMPDGGILRISAENTWVDANLARTSIDASTGAYVVLTVSDTGIGIPPENLNRIFEPFFTTKAFGKGTGLGLSLVVGIVKGHGGFITVESEPHKGAQFKIYLPALESQLRVLANFW